MSKEIKHTELPWSVYSSPTNDFVNAKEPQICTLSKDVLHIERRANAEFICLACNSYYQNQERIKRLEEACIEALKEFNGGYFVSACKVLQQALKQGE